MSTLTTNIRQKRDGAGQNEVTIFLDGNLDNSTVASLEPKLNETLATNPAQLIFDLAHLKFVTSAGIRLFFLAVKQQKQHGGQASFVNLQPQIKEVFAIMGSMPDMRIFRDQAELDAYLLARQKTYNP
jgi:anti-sigma B factor antagonist